MLDSDAGVFFYEPERVCGFVEWFWCSVFFCQFDLRQLSSRGFCEASSFCRRITSSVSVVSDGGIKNVLRPQHRFIVELHVSVVGLFCLSLS